MTVGKFADAVKDLVNERIRVLKAAQQTDLERETRDTYIPIRISAFEAVLEDIDRLADIFRKYEK